MYERLYLCVCVNVCNARNLLQLGKLQVIKYGRFLVAKFIDVKFIHKLRINERIRNL